MAKFYGIVGYAETEETTPGVWDEKIIEHDYYGDVLRNTSRSQSADKTTDDITVDVRISIVADPYAIGHFQSIRYVEYLGSKWEVKSVEPLSPRIIMTLGGLYNG